MEDFDKAGLTMASMAFEQFGRLKHYLKHCTALQISNADLIEQFSIFQQLSVHSQINK